MPRKINARILNFIVLFATACAVFACVLIIIGAVSNKERAALAADGDEESEKDEYEFDLSTVVYARNETCAAVYFTGNYDADFEFRFVCGDMDKVVSTPFTDGLSGDAEIFIVRAADETYNEYVSSPIALNINTVSDIVCLPAGQVKVYDGEAAFFDNAVFYKDGEEATAKSVGRYEIEITYEALDGGSFLYTLPFEIKRAEITVEPKTTERRYLEEKEPSGLNFYGSLSEEDKAFVIGNTVLSAPEVTAESPVGEYAIKAEYNGDSPDFKITIRDGVYKITPALLTGFKMDGVDVLYDGKPHRVTVINEGEVTDAEIVYDTAEATDIGKYRCTATVKKANYEDLVLSAFIVIRSDFLESASLTNYVRIEGNKEGYDPSTVISLQDSVIENIDEIVAPLLADDGQYKETVVGSYDVKATLDGLDTEIKSADGSYSLRIKLNGLDNATGIRIFRCDGENAKETEYRFENGYFVMDADGLDGIVFVKSFKINNNSPYTIITAVIVGAVVLFVILAVLAAVFSGKDRRRSRRRHSRWA